MAKLSLVIADLDEAYVRSVEQYLAERYSQRFQIFGFTNRESLTRFLENGVQTVDILLVCPELYPEDLKGEKVKTTILLSNGRLISQFEDMKIINKYQPGDQLVGSILNIFSDTSADLIQLQKGDKRTKVIGVYSPVGGSGKTTIAVASALSSTQRGKNVFYLNYENIPSTKTFFEVNSHNNLSRIFFYVKSQNRNLSLKIESLKSIDPTTKIHYFAPPENILELGDVLPEEYETLISELKAMKFYDVVFVDMASNFNNKTVKIFEACDEICVIFNQDVLCVAKAEALLNGLEVIGQKSGMNFLPKIKLVLNKYRTDISTGIEDIHVNGKTISLKIPKISPLLSVQGGKTSILLNNAFGEAIHSLVSGLI